MLFLFVIVVMGAGTYQLSEMLRYRKLKKACLSRVRHKPGILLAEVRQLTRSTRRDVLRALVSLQKDGKVTLDSCDRQIVCWPSSSA